jgi:hypothetical protein
MILVGRKFLCIFTLAVFGVVWNHFAAQSCCLTLEDLKLGIENSFRNSKLKIEFHDLIHQVGDWEGVLRPCMDPNFSSGFKTENTQHQCKNDCSYHFAFMHTMSLFLIANINFLS